jgi:hypothetical protein
MRRLRSVLALAVGMALAGAVAAAAAPSSASAADIREVVGGFETDAEGWSLGLGPEFPGAQGTFVRDDSDAQAGVHSGQLTGDFSGGGNYVQIERTVAVDAHELRFWLRTSDLAGIRLRLTDDTGQTHQQRLPLATGAEWQEVTVNTFDGGEESGHWGGANDGTWHGPARRIGFVLDKSDLINSRRIGSVRLDEVAFTAPAPDLAIEQTQLGNVFTEGQPVEFGIRTAGDAVAWNVYDYDGTRVHAGREAISGEVSLRVPVEGRGYYRLEVTAMQGGEPLARQEATFAVLAPFGVDDTTSSPFGFSTHFGQQWDPKLIPLLVKAGAKNIRDELYWSEVEQRRGSYDFPARYDTYMSELRAAGVDPFIIFSYANPHYDNGATPYTDEGRAAYANYGEAILNRYRGQIPWVEVWNEFNISFGDVGDGPADSRPDYYLPLLRQTYEKVKRISPETTVVGAATAEVPLDWLEELFRLGGLEYMDAVSVHPYLYPTEPEQMVQDLEDLAALIKQYNNGESKPIWITEHGWPTHRGSRGISEETQAAYLVRAHVLALSRGVEKYFWYDFMSDGLDQTVNEHNFGVIRNTSDPRGRWAPKPAYVAYAAMTRELTGAEFDGQEDVGAGIYSFVFDVPEAGQATKARVVWSTEQQTVAVRTDEPVTVTDLTGHAETYYPTAGRVYLSISGQPIYVTGRGISLEESGRLTLTAGNDGRSALGEPIQLRLVVDNSKVPRTPIEGSFDIAGESVTVDVPAGGQAEIPVTVHDQGTAGSRRLVGQLRVDGQPVARLATQVDITHPIAVSAKHVLRNDADVLLATVTNASGKDIATTNVDWTLGDRTGSVELPGTLPAGSSRTVEVPLAVLTKPGSYSYELRVPTPNYPVVTHTGTVVLAEPAATHPVSGVPITIDGTLDNLQSVPGIDLATDGEVQMSGYEGVDDLSGNLWFTSDANHLYLSARITDNTHSQPATGDSIWQGDSIQFAVAQGMPGETDRWYEYGVALTSSGPQVHRWLAASGPTGPVTDATVAVNRDNATDTTVYELAIPWELLQPVAPEDQLLSLSLLVNDNDGTGRKGWIEWGSGIGGSKDPRLFQPARLDPTP